MLYILSGQDDFSLVQALDEIKRDTGDQAILETSTTTLDGQHVTLEQLSTVCDTLPFLGGKRLVIIQGLLERFEPGGKAGRRKKTKQTKPADEHKGYATCITKMPDSTVLVLLETKLTGKNPLFQEIAPKAVVKSFSPLKDAQLRQWVQRRVKAEGSSISPPALDLMVKLIGSNLWLMASEINKLALFTSGRGIEEEDVTTVVSYTQQTNVFAMVDAIVEFKADVAERSLEQLLQHGAAPAYLLVMLSRQVRMIVRAKELGRQGVKGAAMQSKLGVPSEFVVRRTVEQAGRYSLPRLKQVYHQLLETDLSIKTGRYNAELALNILVAELCQRDSSRLARSRS